MKHMMKSMQKKQWLQNPNKEYIVKLCKWCKKKILSTEACATLPNKEHSCIKCYKQSGATLPFWDKYNKPTFKK